MVNNRLDASLDYMNKHNIKVSNNVFMKYIDFLNFNGDNIDNLIEDINNEGCLYTCDLNNMIDILFNGIDSNNEVEINTDIIDIDYIKYKETCVYNSPDEEVLDIYEIKFTDGNIIEIASDHLLELFENGVVVTDDGIFALDEDSLLGYIDNV